MKVAIFSDVHGNIIALEQFLGATNGIVDRYLCLGDVVNYGPWNDECLEVIHELPDIIMVEGNHERLFLGLDSITNEAPLVRDFYSQSMQFFTRRDLIDNLPEYVQLGSFCCTHTIDYGVVYPDTQIDVDRNYLVGHTHHQFRIHRSGFTIINPGSVGQNRRWINAVDFAILDCDSGEFTFHSVIYDVDRFLRGLRDRGYPDQCINYYRRKRRRAS